MALLHPSDSEDNSDIISEMEDGMPGAMSDRNNPSRNDCGAVFATNTFLRRHMFKCPQDTESEESSDDEDDCGWEDMLGDCKIKFEDDIKNLTKEYTDMRYETRKKWRSRPYFHVIRNLLMELMPKFSIIRSA